ncbi:MAG TPA: YbhB/YbcL family Raf kinase inhibitor-like protein [Methylibium sp.]|uniref:YbhB/YbcL family Raf kinase inhibitor-like protein n=1 Tax=Methylibium sp. TaxID=2067992 RepID=UPI002DBECD17|nr:YbhB/YbcL family Raf kinase inhibitor-like protein [Methylibium sp.]HEU4459420.1 YbhB/YbcL family Raf kinase inhibitor-like protein [Methylibium sp.]
MNRLPARLATLCTAALAGAFLPALAQQGDGTRAAISTNVFKPAKVGPSEAALRGLQLPPGFTIAPFATGLRNPRILAISRDGYVYVSRRDQGDVLLLKDADRDGRADGEPVQVISRPGAHGLAIKDNRLYLVTVKELFAADIKPDGTLGPATMLLGDLPDSGQHPNRTIAFGPDGMLYLSVGSTCNACNESNPENATILRVSPDGKSRTIFATGLRNTIGFDWQPQTGELWGFDHGIDFLGDDIQPEELNRIEAGKQYGWPHVYADGAINPPTTPVGEITKERWKAQSAPMTLGYTAHAAPMQMAFHRGAGLPAEYAGDAFVAMRGSWNRSAPSGYEIVRVRFRDGKPAGIEPFVRGFLTDGGRTHIARPVGLAIAGDGSMLMADDGNGVIYRIAYAGTDARAQAPLSGPPATAMQQQTRKGLGVPLTREREEARAQTGMPSGGTITVRSWSFGNGAEMPARHSEYADGVSPALQWTPVPGAKSYAIVMEDPDAKPITPFVHWVAWNIPATSTQLPEGLQEQPRLTEPEGMLQGRTSRGSPGYYGPRPPVGDAAHRYHFQVLALDTMLDVPPGADRDQVLAAAKGHVIATGQLVGRYGQSRAPLK